MIFMRGGLQPIPINQSDAYYSKNNILNDAAVNPVWNLTHSTIENLSHLDNHNPYTYFGKEEAKNLVEKIYKPELTGVSSRPRRDSAHSNPKPKRILKNKRPNIVLLLMESWSADIIESLGGMPGITPNFDSLTKDGLLFTNFYASGYTSDLAMPAILSSFHALPIASIVTQPAKFKELYCISGSLKP